MMVWSTERIYWERHTNKESGEEKTIGLCRCCLCGPAERDMPLVRFDLGPDNQPDRYPQTGICGKCIARAQRAISHRSMEAGMVRIGSPYRCSHCQDKVMPVVWFNVESIQEQYICARCLVEAQRQILVEQEDLQSRKAHLQ